MGNKSGSGKIGFNKPNELSVNTHLFENRVIQGMMFTDGTTGSSITADPTHDFNCDISAGIVAVNGVVKEFAAQADYDISHAADAALLADGEAIYYTFIVYWSPELPTTVAMRMFTGSIDAVADAVPVTKAEIDAKFSDEAVWFELATVKFHRTNATTGLTVTVDNAIRPSLIPA